MKISILLPYKENFSEDYAGAVSLFVNDVSRKSKYKNSTIIYGNTNSKKYLSNNYTNIDIKKKIFSSTSNQYVDNFLFYESKNSSDLIEVHNRPHYIKKIKKNFKKKLFLYFHNDPILMSGSKSNSDRLYLLKNVDKIIFNSEWSRKRFFLNLEYNDKNFKKTAVCFQSSSRTKINFKKKKKIISFVGKLNRAKGFDLFGDAVIQILKKYPDWQAKFYGDEPREKLFYKHKNLKNMGFQNNNKILNDLKQTSISVVCSRWNEPFGRTSLEAASRGSAVIISNRGGLPETAPYAIILKTLNSNILYKEIQKLILNPKRLLNLQKKNYKSFIFTHIYISKILDNLRDQFLEIKKVNFFNIKKKKIFKILHLTNFNSRFEGRLHYNTGKRINNGFVRLGHNVFTLSDRDIIHQNRKLIDPKGSKKLQATLINSLRNFNADCLVLGHADSIQNETLQEIKTKHKHLKICQWFLDPLGRHGPDYKKNNQRLISKASFIDASFLTTCPSALDSKIDNSFFIPNPCDPSFETLKNYEYQCANDVFFAMSHGVHRGQLKKGKTDNREIFINKVRKKNKNISFDIYGMDNIQPIWGDEFINAISNSRMGINLSRGRPIKYYSSDRIAQLLGNGLLTFIDNRTMFSDFLNNKQIVLYNSISDLSEKLNKYKKDTNEAKKIAKNGKQTYLKYFNSDLVCDFMLSKIFDYKSKNRFIWNK